MVVRMGVPRQIGVMLTPSMREPLERYMNEYGFTISQAVRVLLTEGLREDAEAADSARRRAIQREVVMETLTRVRATFGQLLVEIERK